MSLQMPPERQNAQEKKTNKQTNKPLIAAAHFMVNKVFNMLCSRGISTESQIKITVHVIAQ